MGEIHPPLKDKDNEEPSKKNFPAHKMKDFKMKDDVKMLYDDGPIKEGMVGTIVGIGKGENERLLVSWKDYTGGKKLSNYNTKIFTVQHSEQDNHGTSVRSVYYGYLKIISNKQEEPEELKKEIGKAGDNFKYIKVVHGIKKSTLLKISAVVKNELNNIFYIFEKPIEHNAGPGFFKKGSIFLELHRVKWLDGEKNINPDKEYGNTNINIVKLIKNISKKPKDIIETKIKLGDKVKSLVNDSPVLKEDVGVIYAISKTVTNKLLYIIKWNDLKFRGHTYDDYLSNFGLIIDKKDVTDSEAKEKKYYPMHSFEIERYK